ncbi:MAG: glutathionylspermidine synthase family protein, partial [Synergistaceae bacterium]|nr:glutathionylspermidine synthase family protein [Synergistaceae bacterium]
SFDMEETSTKPLRLVSIPDDKYSDYRYEVIFKAYKWDPQVGDHNTVAKHAVLMPRETAVQLATWAEQLSMETILMEEALIGKYSEPFAKELRLPKDIYKVLGRLSSYERERHVRLLRFDFHPTENGWAVSEVNSDVPGGFAEASVFPEIAREYFDGWGPYENVAARLFEAFRPKIKQGGRIALVHATSYSDDRQVMQFLSDHFNARGVDTIFAAPDHIRWENKKAVSILEGREGEIHGIIRFFPLEWLGNLPWRSGWQGYYDCETPSCNHPIAIFAQSKRLPLIWDELGVDIGAWKQLLPETKNPKSISPQDEDWIYKPALGRVGEGISIKEAITEKELKQIRKSVRWFPGNWVAQRRFKSFSLTAGDGVSYHLCVGVFTVDGKMAGLYGRISPYPRIDLNARDIPILVSN